MKARLLKYALFLLPVLILIPYLGQVPFQPGSDFSDLMISHYPNALYLQRSLVENHAVPLWSPTILSGYPFAADPLSGLYYLPGWLVMLFPLSFGFDLVIVLHLIWAGVGLYLFLRSEGLEEFPALFGALIFEAMPKLFAHVGAGHITLLYAVPWTPWLFLAESRSRQGRGIFRLSAPGIVLGIIILADIRWAAYAGLAWIGYGLWESKDKGDVRFKVVGETILRVAANGVMACILACPLLLPLAEFSQLSTRVNMQVGENLIESLHPAQLLGLIYPYIQGPAEWALYPGALVLVMFFMALSSREMRRNSGFWIGVVAITLLFSLGSYFPLVSWIFRLPGLSMLRVPPRILFLTGMAFAVVAAQVFSQVLARGETLNTNRIRKIYPKLILLTLGLFAVLFGAAVALLVNQGRVRVQFGWGAVFLTVSALTFGLAASQKISRRWSVVVFFVLIMVDLNSVNTFNLEFRPAYEVLNDRADVALSLAAISDGNPYRVYSPSYSIPQQVSARYRLEMADGVDPLILASYQDYMTDATGVLSQGYSVTLPPFTDDPSTSNQKAIPDAHLLGLLNVKYVVSDFNLPDSGLNLIGQKGAVWIFENPKALPRAWVQPVDADVGESVLSVPEIYLKPNEIRLKASGPGLLVLSENLYPGWKVKVDGNDGEIEPVASLLRGVRLDAGGHVVVFTFAPRPVIVGTILGGLSWTVLAVIGITGLIRRKRE